MLKVRLTGPNGRGTYDKASERMKIPRLKKWHWAFLCLLLVYCVGYGCVRHTQLLVHRVGFETGSDGSVGYVHHLDKGEVGNGTAFLKCGNLESWGRVQDAAYWTFTPLRWAEIAVWHIVTRKYEWRNGPSG